LTSTATPKLPAPAILSAVTNGFAVKLNWSAVPRAGGYNVKRATASGGPYVNVATVKAGVSFTDSSAACQTTYYYAVSAVAPGCESPNSASVEVTTPPAPVAAIFPRQGGIGAQSAGTYSETGPAAVTMSSASGDIWGGGDSFEFAWQELAGDCAISCRVAAINDGAGWSKAGVMIRDTIDSGARNAALLVTPGNGAAFQRRASTDGDTEYTPTRGPAVPYWVKLARRGSSLYASTSADGLTWAAAAGSPQSVALGATVRVGLALSAHDGQTVTAVFDHITVTGGTAHKP
jgi:regulation of enolase protein 1 (concanavalin A-like superfamily)